MCLAIQREQHSFVTLSSSEFRIAPTCHVPAAIINTDESISKKALIRKGHSGERRGKNRSIR